ncbi:MULTISPECIES: exodeoxyribonuclease V subunit beta [Fusobacterium]|uniref:UvrD-helicase domain-containing protein n=1 Tax=Fusobacterium TaxID=848 RepID=UPI001476A8A0|nr:MULTISPECIES: UvrD-helicase domain-containing protein [Fusobacterium]NME35883.1 UvrD-helicase domain-containing protein [Fusobacterium sp. FSA-380-WT-3A]
MSRKILKASAGTGKTYRLALEYVVSLLQGEKFSDIIVMTFTNKATGELEDRILEFLRDLTFETKDGVELKKNILNLYPNLEIKKSKIEKIYKEVLYNKENLKIFTLDAFKILIFKSVIAPMKGIISYDIIDENENLEILKKCFEKISADEELFEEFKDFFALRVERDINKYIEVLRDIIRDRWKYIFIKKGNFLKREGYDYSNDKFVEILSESEKLVKNFMIYKNKDSEPIGSYVNTIYQNYIKLENSDEKFEYIEKNWKEIFGKNFYNGSKIRKSKDEKVTEIIENLVELKEEFDRELAKKIFTEKVIPYENRVLSFLDTMYSLYDEFKLKEKKFTQDDIKDYLMIYMEDKNLNLIEDGKITPYMQEIIDSKCTSIFIDEFQDTSISQWKMLESFFYSAENIICVGDEKQSIYGWRGGEKNLFTELPNILNGEVETLETSFRSEKNIVNFTNEFFTNISEKANVTWDFSNINSNKKDEEGLIKIVNCIGEKSKKGENVEKNLYLEEVLKTLNDEFKGDYRGVGILARKNKTLIEVANLLNENKIPYFLETRKSIFEHRCIVPILKLLKYFYKNNIFYLLEFLRDDIIFVGDDFLKKVIDINLQTNENIKETLEKILALDEYTEEKKIIAKIIYLYEVYNENLSLDNFIIECIKTLSIVDIYRKENDIKNIYKFVEIVKEFDSPQEFLYEVNNNFSSDRYQQVTSKNTNGVNLMTIHKSKGLEFDTVIYVYSDENKKVDKGFKFNLKFNKDYSGVEEYLIIDSSYEEILSKLDNISDFKKIKDKKDEEEEINNLYVALTRPKSNLIILVNKLIKDRVGTNVINEYVTSENKIYIQGVIKSFESKKENIEKNSKDENIIIDFSENRYLEESLSKNSQKIKEDIYRYSLEIEEKRNIGNVIHSFLENIYYGEEEEILTSREKVISKYGTIFERERLEKEILSFSRIKRIIEENEEIFSKKWDIIYNEYSIYSEEDKQLYRIDRLMIDKKKKEILIVDYKTGTYEEEQIENYKKLVFNLLKENAKDYKIFTKYIEIY